MELWKGAVLTTAATCLLAIAGQTQAQSSYTISVDVDDATAGDVQLIEDSLSGAAEGADVPRTMRGIIMGALGEVLPAINARIDENDVLTLDDGSMVGLLDQDVINVKIKKKIFGPVFVCNTKKKIVIGKRGGCQPECVILPSGSVIHIPPGTISPFCQVTK